MGNHIARPSHESLSIELESKRLSLFDSLEITTVSPTESTVAIRNKDLNAKECWKNGWDRKLRSSFTLDGSSLDVV